MILLADEGIDREVVVYLRSKGHEVFYIAEMAPSITDDEVLDIARTRNTVLVTSDKDFGELVFRKKQLHSGVLLLRLSGISNTQKAVLIEAVIREYGGQLHQAFSVVSPGLFRTRPEGSEWK
jgi:predicted nuclease of predicted toxin-antitoxin system